MTTVKTFVTPEAIVRFTNMQVDTQKKRFTLLLSVKEQGKRKFTDQVVEGTMTQELADWLSVTSAEKIKVAADNEKGYEWIPTGNRRTPFQNFLNHRDEHGKALHEVVFEADNRSEDRAANPFRLIRLDDGKNILTLVNVAKRQRIENINPNNGEVSVVYRVKYGKLGDRVVKRFIRPAEYRRLVIQTTMEVEVVAEEQATA